MQTIGARARETARIAYQMFEENGEPAPADEVGSLIASEPAAQTGEPTDSSATGSVTVSK